LKSVNKLRKLKESVKNFSVTHPAKVYLNGLINPKSRDIKKATRRITKGKWKYNEVKIFP
jgi:hypothetical protein